MIREEHPDFDGVAPFYDRLSRIVFGRAITKAQLSFLETISPDSNVLVVGGGTGKFLPALSARIVTGQILFVDLSPKMISIAMRRVVSGERVTFVTGTVDDIQNAFKANVVITHFFFDIFSDDELENVITQIGGHARRDANWIVCDFVDSPLRWHRILLFLMYRFFRMVARLRNTALPDWEGAMARQNYIATKRNAFYRGFIRCILFKRASPQVHV